MGATVSTRWPGYSNAALARSAGIAGLDPVALIEPPLSANPLAAIEIPSGSRSPATIVYPHSTSITDVKGVATSARHAAGRVCVPMVSPTDGRPSVVIESSSVPSTSTRLANVTVAVTSSPTRW